MLFHMPQKMVPKLLFNLHGSLIEQVNEFKFLSLIFDSNLNWKAHLTAVANKVSRIIKILQKLKCFFLSYTSARPEVRGTADVGWRSLNPLPINSSYALTISSMCLHGGHEWRETRTLRCAPF